jgi:hypothetical protein
MTTLSRRVRIRTYILTFLCYLLLGLPADELDFLQRATLIGIAAAVGAHRAAYVRTLISLFVLFFDLAQLRPLAMQ